MKICNCNLDHSNDNRICETLTEDCKNSSNIICLSFAYLDPETDCMQSKPLHIESVINYVHHICRWHLDVAIWDVENQWKNWNHPLCHTVGMLVCRKHLFSISITQVWSRSEHFCGVCYIKYRHMNGTTRW
jgi:hypothetical protein